MNLKIDINNVERSFDRIANDLLTSSILLVNRKEFQFTEIEFYFFHEDEHQDNYTHKHTRGEGEWRFHNQGMDITIQSDDKQDGGILIRGIKVDGKYINGPRKIIQEIFRNYSKVTDHNTLTLISTDKNSVEIIKTFRHLPNKNKYKDFHDKKYRYLVDLDNLEITNSTKEKIKTSSITI